MRKRRPATLPSRLAVRLEGYQGQDLRDDEILMVWRAELQPDGMANARRQMHRRYIRHREVVDGLGLRCSA